MLVEGFGWAECDSQFSWVRMCALFLNVKLNKLAGSKDIYRGVRRTLFFANHTTVADLFLIELITEG